MSREIILAEPHGFCSGVRHALQIAEKAVVEASGSGPVFCLHELVHNRLVVDRLAAAGMIFVASLDEVPDGGTVLFSAHGVSPAVRDEAVRRGLRVIDATCVFVQKVHEAVRREASEGRTVLLVGSKRHDEVLGVSGEAPDAVIVIEDVKDAETVTVPDPAKVSLLTQTTLAAYQVEPIVAILRKRFPALRIPDKSGICAATTVRQEAVKAVAAKVPLVIVLGSRSSANSGRLVDVARAAGAKAELVPDIPSLREFIAANGLPDVIGLTAGASTPEDVVRDAITVLRDA